jgi:hypothetical protein
MRALRGLLRLYGRAFSLAALPPLIGVMLVGAIVLGPHGLDLRDVVRSMRSDLAVRAGILLASTALTRSATQALMLPPGVVWARAAPIPIAWHVLVLALLSFAIQAPIFALTAKGGGIAHGITTALVAASLASTPLRRPSALVSLSATAAWMCSMPDALAMPLGALPAVTAVLHAHRDAPSRVRGTWRLRVRAPAIVALLVTHLRLLAREEGPRVVRSTLLGALIAGFVVLQTRGDPSADLAGRAMVVGAASSMFALAALSRSVGRARRRLLPLVRAVGRSPRASFVAAAVALALPSCVVAVLLGVGLHRVVGVASARALGASLVATLVSMTVCAVGARLEDRLALRKDDEVRWVLVSLGLGITCASVAFVPDALRPWLAGTTPLLVLLAIVARDAEVPHVRA